MDTWIMDTFGYLNFNKTYQNVAKNFVISQKDSWIIGYFNFFSIRLAKAKNAWISMYPDIQNSIPRNDKTTERLQMWEKRVFIFVVH